jgi:hypothetical protein
MNLFFLLFILIHGFIHIIGFLHAYGVMEISQLTFEITKPIGMIWLLATILFVLVAYLWFSHQEWWWIPAIVAIFTSQVLIILTWQDSKFGTIPNVIILVSAAIGLAVWMFQLHTNQEIKNMITEANETESIIITKEMIQPLPTPVQKWLTNIELIGKETIQTVHFQQKGTMKLKPEQKEWTEAEAEQFVTTNKPAFIWMVKMKMFPLIDVFGRDRYVDGKSQMLIKISSLIPVVNVSNNEKVNQSTLQRYLMELPWYPSSALSPYITWESINEYSAKATMLYKGVSGSAIFHFRPNGDLEKISGFRYKESDELSVPIECIGEVVESTRIDGITIPTKLNVSWMLDSGKFTWYRLEISNVKFNRAILQNNPFKKNVWNF